VVVGVGWAGTRQIEAIRELGRAVEVACLVDADAELLREKSAALDVPGTYLDLDAALAATDVDAVSICLPHAVHCSTALAAIEAGKCVLVEKPMAPTVEDATCMIEAAEAAGVTLYVAENVPYQPISKRLRRIVASGEQIGELTAAALVAGFRAPNFGYPGRRAWLTEPELGGTGAWMLHGIHTMAQLRYVFGEVLTSFRMAPGGAQEYFGVTPDLSTAAKAIANGMPLAAVVGQTDLMRELSPAGPALHSGAYTGHLIPVLAALATLAEVEQPGFYDDLLARTEHFYREFDALFARHGIVAHVQGVGARFGIYWGTTEPVWSYQDALRCDEAQARRFVAGCLEEGVFLSLGARGLGHQGISAAHTTDDLDDALSRIDRVPGRMAQG